MNWWRNPLICQEEKQTVKRANQYTNSALNALLGFEPECFANSELNFLIRTVRRKQYKAKRHLDPNSTLLAFVRFLQVFED